MKPILFDLVDTLYHWAMDNAPQWLHDRSEMSAFFLGGSGSFGLVKGIQYLSNIYMTEKFNRRYLPALETAGIILLPAAALVSYVIDPQGFREIIQQHTTYSAGMTGSGIGAILGASQDLRNRRKLESRV